MATHSKNALLLGMVYSKEQVPKRGQEFRDRVRCEAMEDIGYNVYTLDNKHADTDLPKHCNANFSDCRRMMRTMDSKWGETQFDHVILDYFFSPVGWARERWTDPLFTSTFPELATSGLLKKGAKIWLPNLQCIDESVKDFYGTLSQYYSIRTEENPRLNPLCRATDDVTDELAKCPDLLTNATQMKPLFDYSSRPFWVLELKAQFTLAPPRTPTKSVVAVSRTRGSASPSPSAHATGGAGTPSGKKKSSSPESIVGLKRRLNLPRGGDTEGSSNDSSGMPVGTKSKAVVRFKR